MDQSREWEERVIRDTNAARGGQGELYPQLLRDFGRLILRHEPKVYRVCLRITKNPEQARDLTQDALEIAYRKLPEWEGRSAFGTWLCGIAKHLALNAIRRRTEFLSEDGVLDAEEIRGSALKEMSKREREHFMTSAADAVLEPLEQEVVYLRYVENLPLDQITEILDIPGSGARNVLQTCMRKLRPEIKRRLATLGHGTSFIRTAI